MSATARTSVNAVCTTPAEAVAPAHRPASISGLALACGHRLVAATERPIAVIAPFVLTLVLGLLALDRPAFGGRFSYSSQSRSVLASAGSACEQSISHSESAPNFEPFNATVVADGMFTFAEATQSSFLCEGSVVATGSTTAWGMGCVGSAGSGGKSLFSTTLVLDQSASYVLHATFAEYASYTITGPGLDLSAGGFKQIVNQTLDLSGILPPGEYTVMLSASSSNIDIKFSHGSFDFSLRIDGDPNLDGEGDVDGSDLGILLAAWGTCPACCPADLNADGEVDGEDLGLLLAAWGD